MGKLHPGSCSARLQLQHSRVIMLLSIDGRKTNLLQRAVQPKREKLQTSAEAIAVDVHRLRDMGCWVLQICTLEFSRDRKMMSVLAQGPKGQGIIFAKGAPESVLQRCSHVRAPSPSFCPCLHAPVEKELLQPLEGTAAASGKELIQSQRELPPCFARIFTLFSNSRSLWIRPLHSRKLSLGALSQHRPLQAAFSTPA